MLYQFHTPKSSQQLPLQLWMLGINHLQEPVRRAHGVPYFQWFSCVKGFGELLLGQEKYHITKGQGFLIYANQPHTYQALSDDWTLHIIAFYGPVCSAILQTLQMSHSGAYHFSDPTVFEYHIQKLLQICEHPSSDSPLLASRECYDFLLHLSRCMTQTYQFSTAQENPLVLTVMSWLEDNYSRPVSLDELADVLNLSKDYLCTLFKKNTGETIIHCLTGIRIGHARQLLLQYPEKRVVDIARLCGFSSPSYFGNVFKEQIGMAPEQYRKNG